MRACWLLFTVLQRVVWLLFFMWSHLPLYPRDGPPYLYTEVAWVLIPKILHLLKTSDILSHMTHKCDKLSSFINEFHQTNNHYPSLTDYEAWNGSLIILSALMSKRLGYSSINDLKAKVDAFIKKHKHEPTALDFSVVNQLPDIRWIQRNVGIENLRKLLGLSVINHTKGSTRTATARKAMLNSKAYESKYYHMLFESLHKPEEGVYVTREFCYQQWREDQQYTQNIRTDVAISYRDKDHIVLIDFFFPNTKQSLDGCVNSKLRKLKDAPVSLFNCTHELLFVCTNPKFPTLPQKNGVQILSLSEFLNRFALQTA